MAKHAMQSQNNGYTLGPHFILHVSRSQSSTKLPSPCIAPPTTSLFSISVFPVLSLWTLQSVEQQLIANMKILNWVHRKFHHSYGHSSAVYSRQNDDHTRNIVNNDAAIFGFHAETQTLLGEAALVDMPDCWKQGILAIGTLGFDPIKPFDPCNDLLEISKEDHYSCEIEEEEEEDYNVVEDEANPLVRNSHEKDDIYFGMEIEKKILPTNATRKSSIENHQGLIRASDNVEADDNKKGERTTLADLFSADSLSDTNKKSKPNEVLKRCKSRKKPLPALPTKFVKKLIPRAGEDSRPIKKLNQLMGRMLKRKIHPELGGKINTKDGRIIPREELPANEGVSLLSIKDAVIKA